MKELIVIISVFWSVFAFGQEVKLGLPVGHTKGISRITTSFNGDILVSSSFDKTIKIWDIDTRNLIKTIENNSTVSNFELNNNYLLISYHNGDVSVWNINDDLLIAEFNFYKRSVKSFFLFENQRPKEVLSLTKDSMFVNSINSGKSKSIHLNNKVNLKSKIHLDQKSGTLYYFNNKHDLISFNIEKEEVTYISNGHTDIITDCIIKDELIITSSNDSKILYRNILTGIVSHELNDHSGSVLDIEYSEEWDYLISTSKDRRIIYWNLNGEKTRVFKAHSGQINSCQFDLETKTLYSCSNDGKIKRWNKEGVLIEEVESNQDWVNSIQLISQKGILISSGENSTINFYNKNKLKLQNAIKNQVVKIDAAIITPENKLLINQNNILSIINFKSGKIINKLNGRINLRHSDLIGSSNKKLFFSDEYSLHIYDFELDSVVKSYSLPKKIKTITSSPSGQFLLITSQLNTLFLIDMASDKIVSYMSNGAINCGFFNSSSEIYAIATQKNVILFHSNNPNIPFAKFIGNSPYYSVRFSPNDDKLICNTKDGEIEIWNIEKRRKEFNQRVFNKGSISSHFIGSTQFATTGKDGNLSIHHISGDIDTLIDLSVKEPIVRYLAEHNLLHISSKDFSTKFFDVNGRLKHSFNGKSTPIETGVRSNVQFVLTYSKAGQLNLWDILNGDLVIKFLFLENDPSKWVHIHPSGLFDASPEAMDLMYWTKGLEIIDFSQLKARYWLPGLWSKVMEGEQLPDVKGLQELKLQPKVKFGDLKNGLLPINLTKREGGYGKVTIFINGKEVINDARGNNLDTSKIEQTIFYSIKDHPFLVNGENEIVVKTASADGFVQGRENLFSTFIKKKISRPQFFGVVIGVGEYANSHINLKYPIQDANAMTKSLQLGAENLFGVDRTFVYSITSKGSNKPTKANIQVVFETISKKANPEDVIVIYLSGHGVNWGGDQGDFYFLTSDARASTKSAYADPIIRQTTTISTAEWVEMLNSISALKQVMIIDACGSGKAVDNLLASRDVETSQIKAIDRMKDRTGMYIISGCTADAASYESGQYGQGLLTYSILEAMKGAALKSDGSVDVDLMMQHARERVPALADGVGGIQQPQLLAPKGGSFDIGILDDTDQKAIPLASPKKVFVRSNLVDSEEFEDVLGLSDLLDEQLIAISSKGVESNIVYFDAKKYPNACKISGGYTVEDKVIKLSLKIRCGDELEKVELEASSKEELVKKIVELVE